MYNFVIGLLLEFVILAIHDKINSLLKNVGVILGFVVVDQVLFGLGQLYFPLVHTSLEVLLPILDRDPIPCTIVNVPHYSESYRKDDEGNHQVTDGVEPTRLAWLLVSWHLLYLLPVLLLMVLDLLLHDTLLLLPSDDVIIRNLLTSIRNVRHFQIKYYI